MTISVRERIKKIEADLREGAVTPDLARASLMMLTGLVGNIADEAREADRAYNVVLLECLNKEAKANRARIVAETSPEYARAREAKDLAKWVDETIRSCRAYLRSLDTEMQLSR